MALSLSLGDPLSISLPLSIPSGPTSASSSAPASDSSTAAPSSSSSSAAAISSTTAPPSSTSAGASQTVVLSQSSAVVITSDSVFTTDGQVRTTHIVVTTTFAPGSVITNKTTINSKSHTGAIVGGVVGGIVALAIIILAAVCLLRRERQKRLEKTFDGNFDPDRTTTTTGPASTYGAASTYGGSSVGPGSVYGAAGAGAAGDRLVRRNHTGNGTLLEEEDDGMGGRLNGTSVGGGIVTPFVLGQQQQHGSFGPGQHQYGQSPYGPQGQQPHGQQPYGHQVTQPQMQQYYDTGPSVYAQGGSFGFSGFWLLLFVASRFSSISCPYRSSPSFPSHSSLIFCSFFGFCRHFFSWTFFFRFQLVSLVILDPSSSFNLFSHLV
ncbi:hypothetical protein C8J56DRAFT_956793 [Mycena floridula]|nr:hypothetical protein C8J56DRAFT_956793 [Mycena floridula]